MNSKATSLKDKKLISEKLRNENKKMEDRLQQLKLTMSKEKEERLLSGNTSMWSSSAPGVLLNYKPNLSAIDMSKKVKLKILKDDYIGSNERNGSSERHNRQHILTGEILSSRGDNSRGEMYGDRSGGKRKCGQCEVSLAAVNCKECTEIYCAKCFAVFHLKGALRKHRSTPISNITNRMSIPSPLFKPPDFHNVSNNSSHDDNVSDQPFKQQMLRDSKENQSPRNDEPSLANGIYDEASSTQYFQDALVAWRKGEEVPQKLSVQPPPSKSEHSTETLPSNASHKLLADSIKFTPSLSYAEQLLLRKHRSCQLEPVEMKYILNRLAKNSEAERLENQRLLQCNLKLETSAINSSLDDEMLNDNYHVGIGSLTQLWSEAASIENREPSSDIPQLPNGHFAITDVISLSDDCDKEFVQSIHPNCESMDIIGNALPSAQENRDIITTLPDINSTNDIPKIKLSARRSHSALNRNNFNDRPQSARKMSARNDKGGKITTKPSILLEMLASFNEYLPDSGNNLSPQLNNLARSSSAGTSRASSKINYNFYKIAPQTWKPSVAWSDKRGDSHVENSHLPDYNTEVDVTMNEEYEEELNRLNFVNYSHSNDRLSPVSANISGDEDLPHNVDLEYYDRDEEEQESVNQLASFERELTLISRKQGQLNDNGDYDEIIADSLDFDDTVNVMESDKFHFEDSLDFQQRYSKNSEEVYDDLDDELRNCSSRFNDYEDVSNLN